MLKTLKPSNTQFAPVKKKKAQSPRKPKKRRIIVSDNSDPDSD